MTFIELTAQDEELIRLAREVMEKNFDDGVFNHTAGAAVRCKDGSVFLGVNCDGIHGSCAEYIAIGAAITAGRRDFDTIVAVGGVSESILSPCGNCRQMLFEYCPDIKVIICGAYNNLFKIRADELLPFAYIHNDKPPVALTFDDGPSEFTSRILDTLDKHNARASFFVLGNRIPAHREIIGRAHASGNEIISHSWSHCKNPNLSELDAEAIKKELTITENALRSVIDLPQKSPKLFRPPYGEVSDTLLEVSRELDYAIVHWSVDPCDWECQDADIIFDYITSHVHDGTIILCHDVYDSTAQAMERVIPALLKKYRLVTVSELLVNPRAGEIYHGG